MYHKVNHGKLAVVRVTELMQLLYYILFYFILLLLFRRHAVLSILFKYHCYDYYDYDDDCDYDYD